MFRCFFLFATLLVVNPATAHEYWLMPESFTVPTESEIAVQHRLGQRFNGNEMPYIEQWNVRSELWRGGKEIAELRGINGDRPALMVPPQEDGLLVVVHQSNHSLYDPKSWEKFAAYLQKEGLAPIIAAHRERGLDEANPTEAYARFAKTLITVGEGGGSDMSTGLRIEFVAQANPATYPRDKPFPVKLLFQGEPLAGRAVKIFVGADTEPFGYVETDEDGVALIPAEGKGPYLLNAIEMVEPVSDDPVAQKAQWESFWASLTFQRGE
jgi:hypothetical protein